MEEQFLSQAASQARTALQELLQVAKLHRGDILVLGASSSEITGQRIGSASSMDTAEAVFSAIYEVTQAHGLFLAVQCCEHLNRCLILEEEAARRYGYEPVNVVPHPHAGGAFATTAWSRFDHPVAVERIQASAGMDIGQTFIGMHLKPVAVPVRTSVKMVGSAVLGLCRTRPKFVGGSRAQYNEELL